MNLKPNNKNLPLFFVVMFLFSFANAQENTAIWVTVDTSKFFEDTESFATAKQKTLDFARQCALQKAIPEEVAITSLLTDFSGQSGDISEEQTTYSIFALSSVSGYVTKQKIELTKIAGFENNVFEYRVRLKAKVQPTTGERNPAISFELQVKNNFIKDGGKLVVLAKPSVDGYLYLFNFMADNSVLLMLPNRYMKDNFIKANKWLRFPPENTFNCFVGLMPGTEMTAETIFGVFCVNPIADIDKFQQAQPRSNLPGIILPEDSFVNFQKWLSNVPLSQRVEKAVKINIVK